MAVATISLFYPKSRLLKSPNIGMGRVMGVGSRGQAHRKEKRAVVNPEKLNCRAMYQTLRIGIC